jgi:enoyl-CoA hydratase/carnithine racemase
MISLSSPTEKLRVEITDGVARLLIDNATRRNAIDLAMWRAIPPLMAELAARDDVRALVVAGAPGLPFCSGADISEFSTVRATSAGAHAYEVANTAAFDAISALPFPTIAAISGFCMGGGMGVACACDLRIAAEGAVFAIPAGRLGVGYPPPAMRYVVAAVGVQRAYEMFFTARRLETHEALAAGLLAHVYAPEAFADAVEALAATIARNAPLTLKAAKASIRATAGLPGAPSHEDCEALALACFESDDFTEGRTAFLEKRTPLFKGR